MISLPSATVGRSESENCQLLKFADDGILTVDSEKLVEMGD